MSRKNITLCVLALVAFICAVRFLPHAANATPITAVAFIASIYLGKKWAIILPLAALFISDIFIGFYSWQIMASVYGSFALIGLLSYLGKGRGAGLSVAFPLMASSLLFFFVTNTAVWAFSPWYEKSLSGLLYAYELGIPFLRNMFVGDVVYFVILAGVFELAYALSKLERRNMFDHKLPLSNILNSSEVKRL